MFAQLWANLWPNMFAPSIWTLIGVAISHMHLKRHVNRKHDELKKHLSEGS
jgi:hypothetical protein